MNATLAHSFQLSRLRDMAAISSWTKHLPSFSGMELGKATQSIGHWDFYKLSSVYRTVNNIKLLGRDEIAESALWLSSSESISSQPPFVLDLPFGSGYKESACDVGDARDAGSTPGWGRSPGEGNGNPLWCSCLENPMDRGAWQATVHGVQRVEHDWVTNSFTFVYRYQFFCIPLLTIN